MLKLKMKKMPKKPKANATEKQLLAWLQKAAAVKKENQRRQSENKRIEQLHKRIANFK